MISRIVVPLDGSPFGEYALRYAAAIAHQALASIELVHVHIPERFDGAPETITAFRYQNVLGFEAAVDDALLRAEADRLAERALRLRQETGLDVTNRVVRGRIPTALEHEAEDFHADLIVMATHGRGGYDRVRLGSVGDAVAQIATMPILFVRPPDDDRRAPEPAFRGILVPLDGSQLSEQILDPAVALARLFGARISLFHLLPFATPRLHLSPRTFGEAEHARSAAGADYLDGVCNRVAAQYPAVDARLVPNGQPASAILDAVADGDIDVVAMATHGRGGFSRLLFGSTTDAVIHATRRPMLIARPRPVAAPFSAPVHA